MLVVVSFAVCMSQTGIPTLQFRDSLRLENNIASVAFQKRIKRRSADKDRSLETDTLKKSSVILEKYFTKIPGTSNAAGVGLTAYKGYLRKEAEFSMFGLLVRYLTETESRVHPFAQTTCFRQTIAGSTV